MRRTEIILASASPRRHEILTLARIPHRVLTAPADEAAVPFPAGAMPVWCQSGRWK